MTAPAIKRGVCGVCQRAIPMRNDHRLRAHPARTSAAGRRQTCDGSGTYSARLEFMRGGQPSAREAPVMSRAAAFNAREEWAKADALYFEYRDMAELDAADPAAIESARLAFNRALADAEELAPWWDVAAYEHGGATA